jgi:ATP-dependent DNA helicase RecG
MTCFNDTVEQLVKVNRVFANASGGKVLVGVADDGTITGTATDNVSCSRIQDVINQIEPQIDAHISNPGGLPSGLTAQTFGTKSVVRNPIIATLLHRSGYIEKIGTGIKRIEKAVAEHGKGTVSFTFNGFFVVVFSRIRVSQDFPPKKIDKKLKKTTQEINKTTQETTQEIKETTQEIKETTQETILALIKINPAITRKELAEKIGITPNGIKYHLDKLRRQGVIRHVGATKKGSWELVEDDD